MTKMDIRGIGREFGTFTAVRDFTLAVEDGEFVSLLGPSGCGKTTMLRMIAGFIPPSRGTISIDGKVVSSPQSTVPPERRGMSMIFQSYAIWPNMTVAKNVAFGLKLRRLPAAEIKRRVDEILSIVRLSQLADRYPAELSGGQQQRVALARAIVIKPQVLLLDEPLSNLDANLREEMRVEIKRLHTEFKMTTIYVTHDQSEAMSTSDRIVVMNRGVVEQADSPFNLYNAPKTRFVASFIGRTNFLAGTRSGASMVFPSFSVPADGLADSLASGEAGTFSLRPQSMTVDPHAPNPRPGWTDVPGTVATRDYFGDRWDYGVDLGGGLAVTVSTGPRQDFAVGQAVSVGIPHQDLSLVAET